MTLTALQGRFDLGSVSAEREPRLHDRIMEATRPGRQPWRGARFSPSAETDLHLGFIRSHVRTGALPSSPVVPYTSWCSARSSPLALIQARNGGPLCT